MGCCTPYVLDDASRDGALTESGPEPRQVLGLDRAPSATLTPPALDALVHHANPLIIDVSNSAAYVLSHVPGARWCLRSALARTLASTAASGSPLVLTSADGVMARLAASDLAEVGFEDVLVLEGGNTAWCGAGLTPASGPTHLLSPRDDLWLAPSARPGGEGANGLASPGWGES